MEKIFKNAKTNLLFKDISFDEFEKMFMCMNPRVKTYQKGETILLCGNPVEHIGIVLHGSVKILTESYDGTVIIDEILGQSELFAEALACAGVKNSPVSIVAGEATQVMLLDYKKMAKSCTKACEHHAQVIENMLYVIAKKHLLQAKKILILSKYSIREKVMLFFEMQRENSGDNIFEINYNREELAEYICVNRSALSKELCKMRDEGLIEFKKSKFALLY